MILVFFGRILLAIFKRKSYTCMSFGIVSLFSYFFCCFFNKDCTIFSSLDSNTFSGKSYKASSTLRKSIEYGLLQNPNQSYSISSKEAFFCGRSHRRSDFCMMRGDVRFNASSLTFILFSKNLKKRREEIKPYPRKHDNNCMKNVNPITLVSVNASNPFPSDFESIPSDFESISSDFESIPSDFESIPSDFESNPSDFESIPSDFDSNGHVSISNSVNSSNDVVNSRSSTTNFEKKVVTNNSIANKRNVIDSLSNGEWKTKNNLDDIVMECDVYHDVPGFVICLGGYTGNPYHNINEGLIPLFIATRHMQREVVFIVLQNQFWWWPKYGDVLNQLSAYPPVILEQEDTRVHCFSEVTIGIRMHANMVVNDSLMSNGETLHEFRDLALRGWFGLDYFQANFVPVPEHSSPFKKRKHQIAIIQRERNRRILNIENLTALAESLGFEVVIITTNYYTSPKDVVSRVMNCTVVIGVHGADLTNFIFMHPGSVIIQVVILGARDPSQKTFGEPASSAGYKYIPYFIDVNESSLYLTYPKGHWVFSINESFLSWEIRKTTFLDNQDVTLNLTRFETVLSEAKMFVDNVPLA